ncbi:hypothetical protein V8C37DRAFT_393465 [Trichoderma ceciliae]
MAGRASGTGKTQRAAASRLTDVGRRAALTLLVCLSACLLACLSAKIDILLPHSTSSGLSRVSVAINRIRTSYLALRARGNPYFSGVACLS